MSGERIFAAMPFLAAAILTSCEIAPHSYVTEGISFHPVTTLRNKMFNDYSPPTYLYNGKTYTRHVRFPYYSDPKRFDAEGQARSDTYFREH